MYADALSELRTARRMTGSNIHLPVMADSERGLGRPERALELAHSPESRTLDRNSKIELLIVESGARTDRGEHEAAVVVLQVPELDTPANSPTLARLRFAYSEALNRAAREREAETWRERAMDSDRDGTADLYAEVDDDEIIDLLDGDEDDEDSADDAIEGTAASAHEEGADDVHNRGADDVHTPARDDVPKSPRDDARTPAANAAEEDDEDLNQNATGNVKGDVITTEIDSSGGAQFTDAEVTGPTLATPTGPAPLPKFESVAKDEA